MTGIAGLNGKNLEIDKGLAPTLTGISAGVPHPLMETIRKIPDLKRCHSKSKLMKKEVSCTATCIAPAQKPPDSTRQKERASTRPLKGQQLGASKRKEDSKLNPKQRVLLYNKSHKAHSIVKIQLWLS